MTGGDNSLWSDEPTGRDLLSFLAVAETLADAVLDDHLDPIALGLLVRVGDPEPWNQPCARVMEGFLAVSPPTPLVDVRAPRERLSE